MLKGRENNQKKDRMNNERCGEQENDSIAPEKGQTEYMGAIGAEQWRGESQERQRRVRGEWEEGQRRGEERR